MKRALSLKTGCKISRKGGRGVKKLVYVTATLYYHRGRQADMPPSGIRATPKYSAIAKIASSHSNCDRVLVAWIFIRARSSVARICLRKTRALLGSPLQRYVALRDSLARLPRFRQWGTDLPAETNFAEPLEVFIKTTARLRFPGRGGERNTLNSYDKECPFLLISLLEKKTIRKKNAQDANVRVFFLLPCFNFAK